MNQGDVCEGEHTAMPPRWMCGIGVDAVEGQGVRVTTLLLPLMDAVEGQGVQ